MNLSPSKGKGRESTRSACEPGWWDLFPLAETPKRALQWSQSSVMFMAALTATPAVVGRHFSNSKQFPLPSPQPVAQNPRQYLPPVSILVSSTEDYVFAFFPGREVDGIACIWGRTFAADTWVVRYYSTFPSGAGVVGGQWLGGFRQWTFGPNNVPVRLPPQGPRIPTADAVLLLVTEDHSVHLKYARQNAEFKTLNTSLSHSSKVSDNNSSHGQEHSKAFHDRVCVDVAFGTHYSEPKVFIAYRSRYVGPSNTELQGYDLDLNLDLETSTINMSILDLHLRDTSVVMSTIPLPPIPKVPKYVTQMVFMSYPRLGQTTDFTQVQGDNLFFAVSGLDMKDFDSAAVTSTLDIYSFVRSRALGDSSSRNASWSCGYLKTRQFDGALAFTVPSMQHLDPSNGVAFIGVLDGSSKTKVPPRHNETSVGTIRVFNIPDMTENSSYESSPIWSSIYAHGLPQAGVVSPNCKLVWTPSFSLWNLQSSLQLLPRLHPGNSKFLPDAISIVVAILSRRTVGDIIHILARSAVPLREVVTTLKQALQILQGIPTGSQFPMICEIVGVSLEVYRARAQTTRQSQHGDLDTRWETAQQMASLTACRLAFEDCSEGYKYDPSALWYLAKLSSWTLDFVKELMKQCVLASTSAESSSSNDDDDLFGSGSDAGGSSWEHSPILLHLSHPFPLENLNALLMHIKRFRNYIDSFQHQVTEKTWHIAKHGLCDSIDYCPVNLEELEAFLKTVITDLRKLDADLLDESLMACKPLPPLGSHIRQLCRQVADHPTLVDKARAFIEPSDLLDGVSRLSLSSHSTKGKGTDIITKDVLDKSHSSWLCLRCGGRYSGRITAPQAFSTPRWKSWEKRWTQRCICGGSWSVTAWY